jgi:hypothetical protein
VARKPPPIKQRGPEALKFISYIQERISQNPNPDQPNAVFFDDMVKDLVKKSGADIRVTNGQLIMSRIFGLPTKGAELFKFFPNAKDRSIELLNTGLSSREVTEALEAEGLIRIRDQGKGGLDAWTKAYKTLLDRGELKVDKVVKSMPGTDAKIQKQKDVLVKEFLDKNPEIENPSQIAKSINKNSGTKISARFIETSVKRQNLNKQLIKKHEAIFPEVKALDKVIKNSDDILLNEKIPDTERVRELIRRFAKETKLPMEIATENFGSRIFRLGNLYAGTAGALRFAADKYKTIKAPENYLNSPLQKNLILMTSSAKRLSNSGMARLLGLPEKEIQLIDDTAAAMKGFGFDIAGDHTDIKGLMKNFPNYKENFTRIEYIKDSLNKFKRAYDVKITNLARDAQGASPQRQAAILEEVEKIKTDFKNQTGYNIGDFEIKNQQVVINPKAPKLGDSPTPVNTALKQAVYNFENTISPEKGKLPATVVETNLKNNPIDKIAFDKNSVPFDVEQIINKYKGTDIAKNSKYLKAMSKVPVIGKLATAAILGTVGTAGIASIANADTGKILEESPELAVGGGAAVALSAAAALKYNKEIGAFVTGNDNIASQADIKLYAEENPIPVEVDTKPPAGDKSVTKGVFKTLAKVGAPLPTALIDSYFIGQQVKEGKSPGEIASDPLNWIGLAAMEPLAKVSGIAESGKLNKALRLGLNPATIRGISRFAGLPGLAVSTAMTAYDQYKKYQNQEGFVYDLFNKEGK